MNLRSSKPAAWWATTLQWQQFAWINFLYHYWRQSFKASFSANYLCSESSLGSSTCQMQLTVFNSAEPFVSLFEVVSAATRDSCLREWKVRPGFIGSRLAPECCQLETF